MTITIDQLLVRAGGGANLFAVFDAINLVNQDELLWRIRRMPYAEFMRTLYWSAVSAKARAHAGMRCQVCNGTDKVSAHHRTYDCHGREHASMMDITCLCDRCHKVYHGFLPPSPHVVAPAIREAVVPDTCRKRKKKPGRTPHGVDMAAVDRDMPPGLGPIALTKELVDLCRTNGSYTNAALRALGVKAPLVAGWPSRLVGKTIPREDFRAALIGRYFYNTGVLERESGSSITGR